jgi:hypothetical protein
MTDGSVGFLELQVSAAIKQSPPKHSDLKPKLFYYTRWILPGRNLDRALLTILLLLMAQMEVTQWYPVGR